MYTINGRPISQDSPFTDANGTQYPANWIRLSNADEKAAIGIEWIDDPEPYDDRFYWSAGQPKDLEMVSEVLLAQIKTTSYNLLVATDYKITRMAETGQAVDQETLDARAAIRSAYQANKAAIEAATTVEELAALQLAWPE